MPRVSIYYPWSIKAAESLQDPVLDVRRVAGSIANATSDGRITTFNASLREKNQSARRPANSTPPQHPSPPPQSRQRAEGRGGSTSSFNTTPKPETTPGIEIDVDGASQCFAESENGGHRPPTATTTDDSVVDATHPDTISSALGKFTGSVAHEGSPRPKRSNAEQDCQYGHGCNGLQCDDHLQDHHGSMQDPWWNFDSKDGSEGSLDHSHTDKDPPDSADPDHWIVDDIMKSVLPQIFQETSEEIAFTYYYKRVCVCIPAYDSGHNPYRRLAFLSLSYPVLLHGVLSVSTAHMYNYGRSNEALLSIRQGRALNSLRAALAALLRNEPETTAVKGNDGLIPFEDKSGVFSVLSAKEIALAAVMMQTSSVLMTGIGNVEVHIKCALEFIQDLNYLHRPARPVFGRLLVYRFAMVDVVLSHLRFRRLLAPPEFFMYQYNERLDHEDPSFREMHGCPQRVLSFLAQVACLSADVMETTGSHAELQAKAYSLETEMRVWGHKYYSVMAQGSDTDQASICYRATRTDAAVDQRKNLDIVCECFYWVAHILLLRRVFFEPTQSTRVQLVLRHIFHLMDSLPTGCGPDSSLPFPFYMAAREAATQEKRDWVRQKHAAIMEVYRDRSREYMMASTEKMWAKASEVDGRSAEGVSFLDTAYERFIRATDKEASYFMF